MSLDIIYMTYCSENDTESATGRRLKIEITPKMIEAGATALASADPDLRLGTIAEIVFAAMLAAHEAPE